MIYTLAQAAVPLAKTGDDSYLFWALVLLGGAVLLLGLELFIPSGGLIGMLAAIATLGSAICFFQYDTTWGIVMSSSYVLLGPIIVIFGFRLWLNSPLGRRMILGGDEMADDDDDSPMSDAHARHERIAQLRQLIGAQGTAVTFLRPVGVVKINGQRIDAMAESGVIDAGTTVIVTDVYDNQIKVRPV